MTVLERETFDTERSNRSLCGRTDVSFILKARVAKNGELWVPKNPSWR